MGISLNPRHLKRYKDIGRLLMKYGRSDLVKQAGLDQSFSDEEELIEGPPPADAQDLADDLEKLGPTYVKLGQLLSTRPDLLPPAYLSALTRLQDDVEPFAFEEVERIVASELGVRISKGFTEFEREPMAAASLGQVHRATLRDGRAVVVKVQRPGIREQIHDDLEAIEEVAEFLDSHTSLRDRFDFPGMVHEFRRSLARELDYRQEARNLETVQENLQDFDRIVIPTPVDDYTTSKVLTMDYIRGRKITALSPLARIEMDGRPLAEQLFRAYLKQVLVDGFFHADPHPGNVFLTSDGRVALLDLGMVARVSGQMQEHLIKLLLAVSEGRGDEAAEIALQIGDAGKKFDEKKFRSAIVDLVASTQGATAGEMQVGTIILEMTRASGESGVKTPAELTLLGKTLLNLDQVGRTLDPEFEPNAEIRRYTGELMRQRFLENVSPGNVLSRVLELNEFVQELPRRMNRVLDTISNNELRLNVDAIDEVHLMAGLQKIANRITMGLVLAALIVGAAMLMQVETTFRIFGYPGLAMLLFLAAVVGGVWLVLQILIHDEKSDKKG